MNERRPLIAGNWKMNLSLEESTDLVKAIAGTMGDLPRIDVLVAPPFTSLFKVRQAIGDARILLAGQNMHWESHGAYTGEISGGMLLEAGCTHVILGHSERRILFKETSKMIGLKVNSAVDQGLVPVVCIGETLEQREDSQTFPVLTSQLEESLKTFLDNKVMPPFTVLAYEPVWAIGTGKTASPRQAQEVHQFVRKWIQDRFNEETAHLVRILYGGSVKPENIKDLMSMPDIDGVLVGGASLKPESFIPIIRFREA
jgi:triosephosphate isomerase